MTVPFKGLIAGAAGAIVLTGLHEMAHLSLAEAPKLDELGMRTLGTDAAMGVDLASNTMFFSAVGTFGANVAPVTGVLLGLAAGVGSVMLPEPLGLGDDTTGDSREKQFLSAGMYIAGGLVAGLVYRALAKK